MLWLLWKTAAFPRNLKIELPPRPAFPRLTCTQRVGKRLSKRQVHAHVRRGAHDEQQVGATSMSVDR